MPCDADHVNADDVAALLCEKNTSKETKQLQHVVECLVKTDKAGVLLEDAFQDHNQLRFFISYALNRRFGWSENKTKHKQSLNNSLDSFTHILCSQRFTPLLCDILLSAASPSNTNTVSHVVRDQTYKLLFDWIKRQHQVNDIIIINIDNDDEIDGGQFGGDLDSEISDINSDLGADTDIVESGMEHIGGKGFEYYTAPGSPNGNPTVDMPFVHQAVVAGLTDVWSAIRTSCASRLLSLLETFQLPDLETLFSRLSHICEDVASSWQAKEGAVLGIVVMLKAFRIEPTKGFATDASFTTPSVVLQLGRNRYDGLPEFLHGHIRHVLFPLLSHPQLTIRESAKKGLVAFHARTQRTEMLTTRSLLVRSLLALPLSHDALPPPSQLPATHPVTDPYAAEGLLSVCGTILRADIQGLFSHLDWAHHLHAYILYLAHPASTVRIEASSMFKHIVARYTDSPLVICMILQSLAAGWHYPFPSPILPPHFDTLPSPFVEPPTSPVSQFQIPNATQNPPSLSWEWKEGRLLAYELVFRFLLANHTHYTQPHSHKHRRLGRSKLSFSTPTTPNSSAPTTPSTPNRPNNMTSKEGGSSGGGMARSVSLERVPIVPTPPATPPVPPPSRPPHLRAQVSLSALPSVQRSQSQEEPNPLKLPHGALSLIEQLVEGGVSSQPGLPFPQPLPLSQILQHVASQVAESFGFPRWEINRMAEQVLRPLVDVLFLLGTSVNGIVTSVPPSTFQASPPSPISPITPITPVSPDSPNSISPRYQTSPRRPTSPTSGEESIDENATCYPIPMLCFLWYHSFIETKSSLSPRPRSPPPPTQSIPTPSSPQRPLQHLHNRPLFQSHSRRNSSSNVPTRNFLRARSYSNPNLRQAVPSPSSAASIQFMACKSLRHALMLISNRPYVVRARDDPTPSSISNHPLSPAITTQNMSPNSLSPSTSRSKVSRQLPPLQLPQNTGRPSSPNIDRRQSSSSVPPNISQFVTGNLQLIQQRIVAIVLAVITSEIASPSTSATAGSDDRLVVAACELLAIISVSDWSSSANAESHAHVLGQVFQWVARLPAGRKSRVESQILTALHPHLIKLIRRIPAKLYLLSPPSLETPTSIPEISISLASHFVPLVPTHADPTIQTALLDTIAAALDKFLPDMYLENSAPSLLDLENTRSLCSLCSKWLVRLVAKPLEGSVLRSILGVLHRVVRVSLAQDASSDAAFPHILKSLASRLAPFAPHSPASTAPRPPMLNALSLLSNEVAGSWEGKDVDSDLDDVEDEEKHEDWDDDDDTTGGDVVLGECSSFLHDVKTIEPAAFAKVLQSMSLQERSVLNWATAKYEQL